MREPMDMKAVRDRVRCAFRGHTTTTARSQDDAVRANEWNELRPWDLAASAAVAAAPFGSMEVAQAMAELAHLSAPELFASESMPCAAPRRFDALSFDDSIRLHNACARIASWHRQRADSAATDRWNVSGAALRARGQASTCDGGQEPQAERRGLGYAPSPLADIEPSGYATAKGIGYVGWRTIRYPDRAARLLYYSNGFDFGGGLEPQPPVTWKHLGVTKFVVSIHGNLGGAAKDADDLPTISARYFDVPDTEIGAHPDETPAHAYAIVAPVFPTTTNFYAGGTWPATVQGLAGVVDPGRASMATWGGTSWAWGKRSGGAAAAGGGVSAFSFIDLLIERAMSHFPNLDTVYVIGHSAGGQTVHRYAMADTRVPEREAKGVHTRYIAMNPGEYTFLRPGRLTNIDIAAWSAYFQEHPPTEAEMLAFEADVNAALISLPLHQADLVWYDDPLGQLVPPLIAPDPPFSLVCTNYDGADDSQYRNRYGLSKALFGYFEDALPKISEQFATEFESPAAAFAANYLSKDVWHVQAHDDVDISPNGCGYGLQGPTRPHRWWGFRHSLLSWGVEDVPATDRFYCPVVGDEHDSGYMFASPVVHAALDLWFLNSFLIMSKNNPPF